MLGRILPAIAVTVGTYLVSKGIDVVRDKAMKTMSNGDDKKSSAPKDLGTLDYDADSDSYRPKS